MKKNRKYKLLAWLFLASFAFKTIVLADNDVNCNSYGKIRNDLQNVFNLLKIIIPLLVIGLSTYDFIKGLLNTDKRKIIYYTSLARERQNTIKLLNDYNK